MDPDHAARLADRKATLDRLDLEARLQQLNLFIAQGRKEIASIEYSKMKADEAIHDQEGQIRQWNDEIEKVQAKLSAAQKGG